MSKKDKNKAKIAKAKETAKAKEAPKEPEFKIKRIRMLTNCANQHRSFSPGDLLFVPEDVSVETAKSWIEKGAAEEDKSLCAPKEKKIEAPAEIKVEEPKETKAEKPPEAEEKPSEAKIEESPEEKK